MRARMLKSPLWSASLLAGLCVLTASCGASTPTRAGLSPTLTPLPSPTATISPTATATPVADAQCHSNTPVPFVTLPGPLLTTIPFPLGTLVGQSGIGINAGSAEFFLCTPKATSATITAFMDSALPAADWLKHSSSACNAPSYDWYKGIYGFDIVFTISSPPDPNVWALDMCPHVGQH